MYTHAMHRLHIYTNITHIDIHTHRRNRHNILTHTHTDKPI